MLRSARESKGINQTQLAVRMGISQARLSALERAPGNISVDQLLVMCSVLQLQLTTGVEEPPSATDW